ncbi:hypothetical protein FB451DRAFT_1534603 [Mycena latifolia]|nr:hypothetical protein FB451DRAFT_1534603 [Mycena latifolia]
MPRDVPSTARREVREAGGGGSVPCSVLSMVRKQMQEVGGWEVREAGRAEGGTCRTRRRLWEARGGDATGCAENGAQECAHGSGAPQSAAQRALNALRDPVARLPLELSSAIFVRCLLGSREALGVRHAPMLFLNVCNAWTDIALATLALWAGVHADGAKADLESLLDEWFKRAGSRALSVSLPEGHTREVTAVIRRSSLPFLTTLTIVGMEDYDRCSVRGTIDLLRACPALVDCTLDDVFYPSYDDHGGIDIRVLRHAQHFKFGIHPPYSSDRALEWLTLPALQTLFIPFTDIPVYKFVEFLRRSAPPLHKIIVADTSGKAGWSLSTMEECLALLPALTHFELLHLSPGLPPGSWYRKLVAALVARREHVRAVRIVWEDAKRWGPPEGMVVLLRELVVDGMTIYVGTAEKYRWDRGVANIGGALPSWNTVFEEPLKGLSGNAAASEKEIISFCKRHRVRRSLQGQLAESSQGALWPRNRDFERWDPKLPCNDNAQNAVRVLPAQAEFGTAL